jgi:CCR4-NOT transcription complex subunit 2
MVKGAKDRSVLAPPLPLRVHRLLIPGDREFPSLSGAPQAQQNTPAQQMWSSNPNLRATQHSTIQRPQMQTPGAGQTAQSSTTPHQLLQGQLHEDEIGSAQRQFSSTGGDDFRYGGQAGVGQLSGGTQPQTGNIEEFPPLGGGAGDVGPDRRTGLIQDAAAYGNNANSNTFPGLGQTRNGLSSPTDGQQERSINSTVGGRGIHPGGGMCAPLFSPM